MSDKRKKYFFGGSCVMAALLVCMLDLQGIGQEVHSPVAYQDLNHFSKVFGQRRYFRIYLPDGYDSSTKKYPVIYFFHGWGGRYFKDVNAKLEYTRIKKLVDKYQVILVMADGTMDGKEPNPYNVGNHEDVKFSVQYKDYFPELISFIDGHYRTFTDRIHRGLMGFSMGGFMALFLAGEYPDRVCAVMSFAGSAEMFMGIPSVQTLYPVRYTFQNLQDLDVRLHNGNSDILFFLNEEVHAGALWEQKNIQYWTFNGGHMIDRPGQTTVYEKGMKFVTDAFKKSWPAPVTWSHYDIYPKFTLWDYQVSGNKKEPGFLYLKNVNRNGFGAYAKRWLPEGPSIRNVQFNISTAPVYVPNKRYKKIVFPEGADSETISSVKSDKDGRINVVLEGPSQVGITDEKSLPEFVFLDYKIKDSGQYLGVHQDNPLMIRLLNRAGEASGGRMRIKLSAGDTSVHVPDSIQDIALLPGKRVIFTKAFHILCNKFPPPHGEPPVIKFTITEYIGKKKFTDDFTVPVLFDAPFFDSIRVDDGSPVRDSAFGNGNGNGEVNPGEHILVYQETHRLRLYSEDPFVVKEEERLADEVIPARWPDGITLSSVIKIAPDCPDNHEIIFVASYETKAFNPIERKLSWGKVRLIVHRNR